VGHPEPLVQDNRFERAVSFHSFSKPSRASTVSPNCVTATARIEQIHPSSARSLAQLTLPPSEARPERRADQANASALPCVSGAGSGLRAGAKLLALYRP